LYNFFQQATTRAPQFCSVGYPCQQPLKRPVLDPNRLSAKLSPTSPAPRSLRGHISHLLFMGTRPGGPSLRAPRQRTLLPLGSVPHAPPIVGFSWVRAPFPRKTSRAPSLLLIFPPSSCRAPRSSPGHCLLGPSFFAGRQSFIARSVHPTFSRSSRAFRPLYNDPHASSLSFFSLCLWPSSLYPRFILDLFSYPFYVPVFEDFCLE